MYSARGNGPAAPSAAGFGASSSGQLTSSGSELAKDMSMGPFARLERRDSMESISSKGSKSSALTNMTYGFGGPSEVARRRRHHVARHELDRMQEYTVVWVADEERAACACCGAKFCLRLRKHHCRACGEVVCSYCSKSKAMVLGLKGLQRVCDTCLNEEVDKAKANGWALPTLEGTNAGRGNARSDALTPPMEAPQQAVTPPRDPGTQGAPLPDVPVSPASAVGEAQGSSEEEKVTEGKYEEGEKESSPQSTPERPSSHDERAAEQITAEHEHEEAEMQHGEEEERQVNDDGREVVDGARVPVGPLIAEEEESEGEAPDNRNSSSPQENDRGLAAAIATGNLQQAHREAVRATDENHLRAGNAHQTPRAALNETEDDVARAQGGGAARPVVSPSVGGEEEGREERARSEAVSREHEVQEESGGRRSDGVSAGDGEPKQQVDGQQVDGAVRAAGAASGGVAHVASGSAGGGRDEWHVAGTASDERRTAKVDSARERMVSKKGRSQPTTYLVMVALGTIAVTTVLLMRPRRGLR